MNYIKQNKLDIIYSNLEKYGITYITNAIDYKKSIPIQIFNIIDFIYELSYDFDKALINDIYININKNNNHVDQHVYDMYTPEQQRNINYLIHYNLAKEFNNLLTKNKIAQKDHNEFSNRYKATKIFRAFVNNVIYGANIANSECNHILKSFAQFITNDDKLMLNCFPYSDASYNYRTYDYTVLEELFDINLIHHKYIITNTMINNRDGLIKYLLYTYDKNKTKLLTVSKLVCISAIMYPNILIKFTAMQSLQKIIHNSSHKFVKINTKICECLRILKQIYSQRQTDEVT